MIKKLFAFFTLLFNPMVRAIDLCDIPPMAILPCYHPSYQQEVASWKLLNIYGEIIKSASQENELYQWAIYNDKTHPQLTKKNEGSLMICNKPNPTAPGGSCVAYTAYKKEYKRVEASTNGQWAKKRSPTSPPSLFIPYKSKEETLKELTPPCPPRAENAIRETGCPIGTL